MEQNIETLAKNARPNQPPVEGSITKTIEEYTAKVPSMAWLWLAVGSMAVSAGFAALSEKKGTANFIGMWAPSLLLIGVYNKLVKMEHSIGFNKSSLH
jgi:hypothetical protein